MEKTDPAQLQSVPPPLHLTSMHPTDTRGRSQGCSAHPLLPSLEGTDPLEVEGKLCLPPYSTCKQLSVASRDTFRAERALLIGGGRIKELQLLKTLCPKWFPTREAHNVSMKESGTDQRCCSDGPTLGAFVSSSFAQGKMQLQGRALTPARLGRAEQRFSHVRTPRFHSHGFMLSPKRQQRGRKVEKSQASAKRAPAAGAEKHSSTWTSEVGLRWQECHTAERCWCSTRQKALEGEFHLLALTQWHLQVLADALSL